MLHGRGEGNRHPAHLAPQGGPAAQTPQKRGQRPHEGVHPQILRPPHKQEHCPGSQQLDGGVLQRDGTELVQPHQAPVQVHQTADGHHGQVQGDQLLPVRHKGHIAKPHKQRQPRHAQLHQPDFGKGAVKGVAVVPGAGDGAHAVIFQPQHAHQHKYIADGPGVAVQPHALRPHRAGKIRRGDQGQQHGKHAVGHVVQGVFAGAHGQTPLDVLPVCIRPFSLPSFLTGMCRFFIIRNR